MSDSDEHSSEDGLCIVMDSFGDWTPFAALTDSSEAIELRKMLSEDAEAVCTTAPYYEDKQSVRDGETAPLPDLSDADEICVTFEGQEVHGVSTDDWAARELQFEIGGLRDSVSLYDTAEEVVTDCTAAVGKFIIAQMTADDLLEAVR